MVTPMEPVVPDVTQLRALTHPVRLRILGLLRTLGPTTASQVARRLGLNSGATSYHLRQLAEHGFVEEAPELGNKRERWWRASTLMTSVPERAGAGDEGRDATDAFHQLAVTHSATRMQAAAARRGGESDPWRAVTSVSDLQVAVTAEQAAAIQSRFEDLVWQVLDEFPQSSYLRTDQACTSLAQSHEGQPIYVVFFGPFPVPEDACAARAKGTPDAYAKQLTNSGGATGAVRCDSSG